MRPASFVIADVMPTVPGVAQSAMTRPLPDCRVDRFDEGEPAGMARCTSPHSWRQRYMETLR
jgi:hypothetical protein